VSPELEQVLAMGFEKKLAKLALAKNGNGVPAAIEQLLSRMGQLEEELAAAERATTAATEAALPTVFELSGLEGEESPYRICNGRYRKSGQITNGRAVWMHEKADRCLYLASDARTWYIHNKTQAAQGRMGSSPYLTLPDAGSCQSPDTFPTGKWTVNVFHGLSTAGPAIKIKMVRGAGKEARQGGTKRAKVRDDQSGPLKVRDAISLRAHIVGEVRAGDTMVVHETRLHVQDSTEYSRIRVTVDGACVGMLAVGMHAVGMHAVGMHAVGMLAVGMVGVAIV
jgi:hypothetical protein